MQVELNVAEVYEKRTREKSAASEEVLTVRGWKVSARQCELITLGDRAAVDRFFEDNLARLKRAAGNFKYSPAAYDPCRYLLEIDDLINQVYVDMRRGFLVMDMNYISALVFRSFKFAAVGGFGDELGAYEFKPKKPPVLPYAGCEIVKAAVVE